MKKYALSILIPSRHEEWLGETVKNILANKRGDTEILVGLDGAWPETPLPDHPDVRVIFVAEAIGQRQMGNKLARLSTAKYIAKTDAHCAFDEGFDVKLMEAMQPGWTIIPAMKNLHAFNWVCEHCGMEYYQGEKPELCRSETCHFLEQKFNKRVVFEPRNKLNSGRGGPTSVGYRFTPDKLQFKYFNSLKGYFSGELTESMSVQGSFFMCERERYHTLNMNDDSWGGWGQQGTEVALKTWLSGGKVMIHRGTWYAHMFRTNGQLAFPWNKDLKEGQGSQQRRSRQLCIDLFKNNRWEHQTRPLSWLVERFWEPLQKEGYGADERPWSKEDLAQLKLTEGRFAKDRPKFGILYLTDNELPLKIAKNVQGRIRKIAQDKDMELVSSSRKPMDNMGINVVTRKPRGYQCYFTQILKGLEAMSAEYVFIAEHDVLYPSEHFDFAPTDDKIYYDVNWFKVHDDGLAVSWEADQVSGLCAKREVLLNWYRDKVATFDPETFDRKFEPLSGEGSAQWKSPIPYIDIRTGRNLTYNKRKLSHFRKKETAVNFQSTTIDKIPHWNLKLEDIF